MPNLHYATFFLMLLLETGSSFFLMEKIKALHSTGESSPGDGEAWVSYTPEEHYTFKYQLHIFHPR